MKQSEKNRKFVHQQLEALIREAGCVKMADGSWHCTSSQAEFLEELTSEEACRRITIIMNSERKAPGLED